MYLNRVVVQDKIQVRIKCIEIRFEQCNDLERQKRAGGFSSAVRVSFPSFQKMESVRYMRRYVLVSNSGIQPEGECEGSSQPKVGGHRIQLQCAELMTSDGWTALG